MPEPRAGVNHHMCFTTDQKFFQTLQLIHQTTISQNNSLQRELEDKENCKCFI